MSKTTEEILLAILVGIVLIKVFSSASSSSNSSSLAGLPVVSQLASIGASQNVSYANDATDIALGIFGD